MGLDRRGNSADVFGPRGVGGREARTADDNRDNTLAVTSSGIDYRPKGRFARPVFIAFSDIINADVMREDGNKNSGSSILAAVRRFLGTASTTGPVSHCSPPSLRGGVAGNDWRFFPGEGPRDFEIACKAVSKPLARRS